MKHSRKNVTALILRGVVSVGLGIGAILSEIKALQYSDLQRETIEGLVNQGVKNVTFTIDGLISLGFLFLGIALVILLFLFIEKLREMDGKKSFTNIILEHIALN